MKRLFSLIFIASFGITGVYAQLNNSGVSAGFFDSSEDQTINFSNFHLPPLGVLFENAKSNPSIESLAKSEEIAKEEASQERKHIFTYVSGHANYSYGMFDNWGNSSTTLNPVIYQYQGSTQSYWNVGASLTIPLGDALTIKNAIRRKRLQAEKAGLDKDVAYDELKQRIATLYVSITNDLVSLKTASENAAIYQGAGKLNENEFQHGNLSIGELAETKRYEEEAVDKYQSLQTQITSNIMLLEILTRTPILTNTTTEVNLSSNNNSTKKDDKYLKENRTLMKNAETTPIENNYVKVKKGTNKK